MRYQVNSKLVLEHHEGAIGDDFSSLGVIVSTGEKFAVLIKQDASPDGIVKALRVLADHIEHYSRTSDRVNRSQATTGEES